MNSITAEILNLIIFILVFSVLYFNLMNNNLYLKNFLFILVIGYFGLVDLKYGLLLLVLYMIDLNNKEEQENFHIWDSIKTGVKKVGGSVSKLGKKYFSEEEDSLSSKYSSSSLKKKVRIPRRESFWVKPINENNKSIQGEEQENFYIWDKVLKKKKKPVQEEESRPDIQEDFISLKSISDSIGNNETFKSLKKYAKKGARNILKSIQEEEAEALPENEEEQEEEEDDDIENFTVRDKKKTIKESLKSNFLLNQLKKNDILDDKLENFQGKIENKLEKINKFISKLRK